MKIDELHEGRVFKNYKDLCNVLDIPIRSGNSKITQMKELERFCLLSRDGNKLVVQEVFDIPLPERKGRGGKNIYGDLLTLLITDRLIEQWKSTGISTVFMTRNDILKGASMINHNFSFCSANINPLSDLLKMNTNVIYDFFNSTSSTFSYSVEASLDALRKSSLLMYDKITMVRNSNGKHVKANYLEKEFILKCEKDTLEEMGYRDIPQVRVSRNWEKFKRKVSKKLKEDSNFRIDYYYTSYEITLNTHYIEAEHNTALLDTLESINREEEKDKLNTIICNRLLENAKNRKTNTVPPSRMYPVRNHVSYVEDNQKLIDVLIDNKSEDVTASINSIKKSKKISNK